MAVPRLFCHFAGHDGKSRDRAHSQATEIQGYIQDLETKARRWRTRLAHIDATLTIFSPDIDPEAIQPKRRYRRGQYFRRSEFFAVVLGGAAGRERADFDGRCYRQSAEGEGITR